jgi:hypothetical protein
MEFLTEMEQTVARLRAINGVEVEDDQVVTQVLMSLPSSLKLTFGVAWDSTPRQEKTLKNLTARLIKLEKNLKQSEEEKLSDALVSLKGEQKKSEEAEDHALPVRDNRQMKQSQDKRRCWECGDDSHVRSKCRVFKRRLERERDERERDYKRRRHDSPNRENERDRNRMYDNRNKRHDHRERRDDNRNRRSDNRDRREHSYSVTMGDGYNKNMGWYADSGATQHMTGNRGLLSNFVPIEHDKWTVSGIGEAKLQVAGQGDVNLHATVDGRIHNGDYW